MSIRQSFVCYLVLPPARQSATSGVNMRSTLGKSLLREEVHELHREWTRVGSGVSEGWVIAFGEDDTTTRRKNVQDITYGLEGFLQLAQLFLSK